MAKRPAPDEAGPPTKPLKSARLTDAAPSNSSASRPSSFKSTYPPQLDVSSHLTSHSAQILTLQRTMRLSRSSASTRAWQLLPRTQRRRAASFNLLALPKRLRAKGAAELASSNTLARTRAQTRKRAGKGGKVGGYPRVKERGRRVGLLERQKESDEEEGGRWLETHLWHAKRFRMSGFEAKVKRNEGVVHGATTKRDRWGYSIAEQPNIKGRRKAARAVLEEAAIVDMSYLESVRVCAVGAEEDERRETLKELLGMVGVEEIGDEKGALACQTRLLDYAPSTEQRCAAVAPITILWQPQTSPSNVTELLLLAHPASLTYLLDALTRALAALDTPTAPTLTAQHLARATSLLTTRSDSRGRRHSSALEPGSAAAAGARRTKRGGKKAQRRKLSAVQKEGEAQGVDDEERELLRDQAYNVFDLYGPEAGRVLGGVLRPVASTSAVKREAWRSITRFLKPAQVRPGAVLALEVHDPRLSFPPNNTKGAKMDERAREQMGRGGAWFEKSLVDSMGEEDIGVELAVGRLLTEGARPPRFSKGEIDSRRSKSLLPGTRLDPSSYDDVIPVLILSLTSPSSPTSKTTTGYRLLLPRTWGLPFWLSLTHTSSHVLSLDSLTHQALEQGVPSYPSDWPASPAGREYKADEALREREEWERRPNGKRVNWEKEGTRWPWGGRGLWKAVACAAAKRAEGAAGTGDGAEAGEENVEEPWLLATPHAGIDEMDLSTKAAALVHVRIKAVRRGAFGTWAEIHLPTSSERVAWTAALRRAWREEGSEEDEGRREVGLLEQSSRSPQLRNETLIGATTNGQYALARGQGEAIASISWLGWKALVDADAAATAAGAAEEEQNGKGKTKEVEKREDGRTMPALERLVLVKEREGGVWRAATAELC